MFDPRTKMVGGPALYQKSWSVMQHTQAITFNNYNSYVTLIYFYLNLRLPSDGHTFCSAELINNVFSDWVPR